MGQEEAHSGSVTTLEENLKKAMTEMILLHLLSKRESYIGELTEAIVQKSGGKLRIVFPYSAIYRLLDGGNIYEKEKRFAPDGRRRQYYAVTDQGREYLARLMHTYSVFTQGLTDLLAQEGTE
ncbi:MAG: PadR family transcriptional regulator [Ruminococcaceae bacterium]|nr:PadR family transcriptional regulator [Oscillospiraceae bacterium]